MDEATLEAVRAAVRAVPAGETSTYGEIAATAGIPGRARLRAEGDVLDRGRRR